MFKTFSHAVQRLGLHSHAGFWGLSPLCLRQAASGCLLYSCWGPPGYAAQRGHLSLHQPRQFRQPVRRIRCPSAYATLQPGLMRGSTSKLQPRASSPCKCLPMNHKVASCLALGLLLQRFPHSFYRVTLLSNWEGFSCQELVIPNYNPLEFHYAPKYLTNQRRICALTTLIPKACRKRKNCGRETVLLQIAPHCLNGILRWIANFQSRSYHGCDVTWVSPLANDHQESHSVSCSCRAL